MSSVRRARRPSLAYGAGREKRGRGDGRAGAASTGQRSRRELAEAGRARRRRFADDARPPASVPQREAKEKKEAEEKARKEEERRKRIAEEKEREAERERKRNLVIGSLGNW